MSGIEVLSLVANIFQVIGFATDTIRLCNDIYQGRAPAEHLGEHATTLQALSTEIQSHYNVASTRDKELEGIARKCAVAARALEEEVRFATKHHAQGDLAATLRVAFKTLWRKNRLAKLEGSLGRYQTTMESHLLFRVCKQSDAVKAQQEKGFEKLDKSIQFFISQYAAGQKTLSGLIDSNMRLINDHSTKEARQVEVVVASHVTMEISSAEQSITKLVTAKVDATQAITHNVRHHQIQMLSDRQRERFLSSLKFKTMNKRRNYIKDSHHGTFMWMYNLDPDSDAEESEFSSDSDWEIDSSSNDGGLDIDKRWDDFQEWLLSDSNIYWISGKPGSGKSTLVKFLATNKHTQAALDQWREGSIILSHFFWKPGNKMQNSLKGLLCTLLHQALSREPTVLDNIFAQTESYRDKDHDTDWSVAELRPLCLDSLSRHPSPICIFLDGLDEICRDDVPALLELVDDLKDISRVKICVSSRPEAPFLRRLRRHQNLRLQDLTERDMRTFAKAILVADRHEDGHCETASREKFPTEIIEKSVDKAQGVFLWLHLATRSLLRGWENGDSPTELAHRLEALPSELSELYTDMWARLNEDSLIYRKTAAEYFHLVLSAESLNGSMRLKYRRPLIMKYNIHEHGNLLQIMAVTTSSFRDEALNISSSYDMMVGKTVHKLCQETKASIQGRCAGLLEVQSLRKEEPAGLIDSYKHSRVAFIHRTAYDFLTDSEKGKEILSFYDCQTEVEYLRLIRGELACSRVTPCPLRWLSSSMLCVESPALQPKVYEVLRVAWKFYHAGHIQREESDTKVHFLSAISSCGFGDFAMSAISQSARPGDLATDILRHLFLLALSANPYQYSDIVISCDFIRSLLAFGANPNSRGDRLDLGYQPPDEPTLQLSASGMWMMRGFVLDTFGVNMQIKDITVREREYHNILEILLESEPDLDERAPVEVWMDGHELFTIRTLASYNWEVYHYAMRFTASCKIKKLGFVLNGSLAFLLELIRRRKRRQMGLRHTKSGEWPTLDATDSLSEELVRVSVVMFSPSERGTASWAFRVVNEDTGGELATLVRRWLLSDVKPGTRESQEIEEEISSEMGAIRNRIIDRSGAYRQITEPIEYVLEAEGCGYGRCGG